MSETDKVFDEVITDETEVFDPELANDEPEEVEVKPESDAESTYIDYNEIADEQLRKKVQARVNADWRKIQEAKEKAERAERERRELENKILESERPKEVKPPNEDLIYDDPDKYRKQSLEYASYLGKVSEFEKRKSEREQQEQLTVAEAQKAKAMEFFDRAGKAGLDLKAVSIAGDVVGAKVRPELADFIINHAFGAQIILKLAEDQMSLGEIASLPIGEASVKIHEMSRAFQPKRKTTAPPPDEPLRGKSTPLKSDEFDGLLEGGQIL